MWCDVMWCACQDCGHATCWCCMLRLNFVRNEDDDLCEGLKRLHSACKDLLPKSSEKLNVLVLGDGPSLKLSNDVAISTPTTFIKPDALLHKLLGMTMMNNSIAFVWVMMDVVADDGHEVHFIRGSNQLDQDLSNNKKLKVYTINNIEECRDTVKKLVTDKANAIDAVVFFSHWVHYVMETQDTNVVLKPVPNLMDDVCTTDWVLAWKSQLTTWLQFTPLELYWVWFLQVKKWNLKVYQVEFRQPTSRTSNDNFANVKQAVDAAYKEGITTVTPNQHTTRVSTKSVHRDFQAQQLDSSLCSIRWYQATHSDHIHNPRKRYTKLVVCDSTTHLCVCVRPESDNCWTSPYWVDKTTNSTPFQVLLFSVVCYNFGANTLLVMHRRHYSTKVTVDPNLFKENADLSAALTTLKQIVDKCHKLRLFPSYFEHEQGNTTFITRHSTHIIQWLCYCLASCIAHCSSVISQNSPYSSLTTTHYSSLIIYTHRSSLITYYSLLTTHHLSFTTQHS